MLWVKELRTIDGLALRKIAVVLAVQKTVSISSYYSFNVPVTISTQTFKVKGP